MAVELFEQFCERHNLEIEIFQEKGNTHTAQASADAYGVGVNRIVKSLLVKIDDEYMLFLVPGDKRLDLDDVKERFSANKVRMANANEVKEITGHSIGGVPPFGHKSKLKTYIESGFPEDSPLLAAAGKEDAVFWIELSKLKEFIR